MKRAIFILFVLLFFISTPLASAQVGTNQYDIEVSMIPENPAPNEAVYVTVKSFVTDINAATITWSVNGKIIKSAKGEKSFTFTTGNDGSTTILGVLVKTKEGGIITNTFNIKPVSVDILWQSESYVPPFYKGKALFSFQNKITFIAMPHMIGSSGARISPKNLIYKWTRNGSVMESDSGYGKNTFTVIPGVISRPLDIAVEVSSPDSGASGFARISVAPTDPFLLFYEKDPLYGIEFQKALVGTVEMKNSKEIAVVGVPFFFGETNPQQNLSYKWSINGAQIDDDLSQTTRVFRQIEGVSGTSNISVRVEDFSKILQATRSEFNLKFGAPEDEGSTF